MAVPLNAKPPPNEAAWAIDAGDWAMVTSDSAEAPRVSSKSGPRRPRLTHSWPRGRPVRRQRRDPKAEDLAWLYTSGTTGKPEAREAGRGVSV